MILIKIPKTLEAREESSLNEVKYKLSSEGFCNNRANVDLVTP